MKYTCKPYRPGMNGHLLKQVTRRTPQFIFANSSDVSQRPTIRQFLFRFFHVPGHRNPVLFSQMELGMPGPLQCGAKIKSRRWALQTCDSSRQSSEVPLYLVLAISTRCWISWIFLKRTLFGI